jgi:hypothetical protein
MCVTDNFLIVDVCREWRRACYFTAFRITDGLGAARNDANVSISRFVEITSSGVLAVGRHAITRTAVSSCGQYSNLASFGDHRLAPELLCPTKQSGPLLCAYGPTSLPLTYVIAAMVVGRHHLFIHRAGRKVITIDRTRVASGQVG